MYYYSFNRYLREKYGEPVRKICLNPGFACPNRDGALSRDGCVFCNEKGFSRNAGTLKSLEEQIEDAVGSGNAKRGQKYIAYFQNAAGTNASPEELQKAYDIIRNYPEIIMLTISTRPDCVDDGKLDLISDYAEDYEVWIEYGVQTANDAVLERMKRNHSFEQAEDAILRTVKKGIKAGAHIMLGLPGESREDMALTARRLAKLPVSGIKLHVLHVLKDTALEEMYRQGKVDLLTQNEYARAACDFLEYMDPECVVLRLVSDAHPDFLVAPMWINDKNSVIADINKEFLIRGTHQGSRRVGG
ncbi:MAG: TIGR01212 family radical SAM protein [Candidatus Omnitrophica bacterium]|nr:TIGR01212 family radical SAM protein [Candidatus Omnitrophota bacterium]